MKNQTGQIVIVLLLTVVVALAIGLSISTRSINDISTATKTEQSSRAYSAAEAGIEKALQETGVNITGTRSLSLGNQSDVTFTTSERLPTDSSTALEYGSLEGTRGVNKKTVAQIWLADPNNNLTKFYSPDNFDIYFGNPDQSQTAADAPAIEAILVKKTAAGYCAERFFVDSSTAADRSSNGFAHPGNTASLPSSCNSGSTLIQAAPVCDNSTINTIFGSSKFLCHVNIKYLTSGADYPIMVRIRLLYSSLGQKVAVRPTSSCVGSATFGCALPKQARIITSVGSAGTVQRRIQVFQQDFVVPPLLDYVLYSATDVSK